MTDKTEKTEKEIVSASPAPEPAPVIRSAHPDEERVRKVRTSKRSDAVQAFMQTWLSQHPIAADAFTAEDAVALLDAADGSANK